MHFSQIEVRASEAQDKKIFLCLKVKYVTLSYLKKVKFKNPWEPKTWITYYAHIT